jgi:hypothetical protein
MRYLGEVLLAMLVLFAADACLHLRLTGPQFLACVVPWPVCLLAGRLLRRRKAHGWPVHLLELVLPGPLLNELAIRSGCRWSLAQMVYVVLVVAVLVLVWRRWLAGVARHGVRQGAEALRLLLAGGAAVWVTLPFFTDRFLGGTDARWYAYMFKDFLDQWRAGIFPVFVGQGEFAVNGGVHPFRSAPFHFYLGWWWDVFTTGALSSVALQHLTVITSALVGAVGLYVALTQLTPGSRWPAAAVAVIYVTCPGLLVPLYSADMYMTYMVVAVMPLVVYGNGRLLAGDGCAGYPSLTAGLALLWTCHPPVALLATLATIMAQGGRFLFITQSRRAWQAAAGGALLFVLLAAFYFYSMSELPRTTSTPMHSSLLQMIGLGLWLWGVTRGLVWRQWTATWLLLPGGVLLYGTQPAWFWCGLLQALLAVIVAWQVRRQGWFDLRRWSGAVVVAAGLLGVLLTPLVLRDQVADRNMTALAGLAQNATLLGNYLRPLSPDVLRLGDCQPGFGLWMLFAVGAVAALAGRSIAVISLWLPAALLSLAVFRVPGLSDFLVAYFPRRLAEVASLPLSLRLMPVVAAFVCGAGHLGLSCLPKERAWLRRAIFAVVGLLAVWGVWEARKCIFRGWMITSSRSQTAVSFRSENAVLDRYAYDLLPLPDYFSNGKTDGRLENRLLDAKRNLLVGPDAIAKRMEQAGAETLLLTTRIDPNYNAWLNIEPALILQPGEHRLLRFEFLDKVYNGYLILKSEHGYRDYSLPDSGNVQAFGVGPKCSKVLSLWNSGDTAETVNLAFKRIGTFGPDSEFGDFARVTLSHYDPTRSPVRIVSWIPYRAEVEMKKPGFLETPRVFLPGYVAKEDGRPVEVQESPQHLTMVPLSSGRHVVELRFAGSARLWTAWWLSTLAWAGLLGRMAWGKFRFSQLWQRQPGK